MIADVITAIVSGFSDVLGKSLGRYRYLAILIGSYSLVFLFSLAIALYSFFVYGGFRWYGALYFTLILGSILGVGGVFIAFVNRPRSANATESIPASVDAAKPDSSIKATTDADRAAWGTAGQASTTMVVKPDAIANDPTFKQLANREVPTMLIAKPTAAKTEDQNSKTDD